MKAIQIKYLSCTDTLPARLKVWAEGQDGEIATYSHAGGVEAQAREMAAAYIAKRNWGYIKGFGCLPNGDYVATLSM